MPGVAGDRPADEAEDSRCLDVTAKIARAHLNGFPDYYSRLAELAALLPIARPGVSRHLRVLREAGLVEVRQDAQRRLYSLRLEPLAEIDEWLARYRPLLEQRFDALHTEVARGKRERRSTHDR